MASASRSSGRSLPICLRDHRLHNAGTIEAQINGHTISENIANVIQSAWPTSAKTFMPTEIVCVMFVLPITPRQIHVKAMGDVRRMTGRGRFRAYDFSIVWVRLERARASQDLRTETGARARRW